MLFFPKSVFFAAALMAGNALVRAQSPLHGIYKIVNSNDESAFVPEGQQDGNGAPVLASRELPQDQSSLWNITQRWMDADEYLILNVQYSGNKGVTSEGGPLVTTSDIGDTWTFRPQSDGFYLIQKYDGNLTWTSVPGPDGASPTEIHLTNEDNDNVFRQFRFIRAEN